MGNILSEGEDNFLSFGSHGIENGHSLGNHQIITANASMPPKKMVKLIPLYTADRSAVLHQ